MNTIVIAPHPDDELLGTAGALLRRKEEGSKVAWLIVTSMPEDSGWSAEKIRKRSNEIKQISDLFQFDSIFELGFPTAQLDQVPMSELVSAISNVFDKFKPEEVFLPHPSDIHTDHRLVFDAVASCSKWFRHPSVKRVLAYETLSETDFNLGISQTFKPNVFINIEKFLDIKLSATKIYGSEFLDFPFPRSIDALKALATLRGAASGCRAAEAFELLREIE